MNALRLPLAALFCLGASSTAYGLSYELGDIKITGNNRLSTGLQWRVQDRNGALIGKTNIPGQSGLCATDNCISIKNPTDPAPNQRLVNAQGAFSGVNSDDGDINYDKWDIVAATNKLNTDWKAEYGNFLFRLHALAFYDPVNAGFNERHFDTRYQPYKTRRPSNVEREFAKGVNLLDANASYGFDVAGHSGTLTVGQQTVRWGESTLVALNSISEINPPNAAALHMVGSEINEVFQPVPAVVLSGDLFQGVSAELVYQFGWKKAIPDQRGAFFSTFDLIGGNDAAISLGQFGEDPMSKGKLAGSLRALSNTGTEAHLSPEHRPSDGGQYGLRLNYLADWLGGGTETSFYFLNYHSRLPYATAIATDDSCARNSTNLAEAYISCNGFDGTLPRPLTVLTGPGKEPLPIDTFHAYLEYPENIQMYGFSFNTTVGKYSLAGELSFRPNVPLQVQLDDVIFTALQPAFPAQTIQTDPTGVFTNLPQPLLDALIALPGALGQVGELANTTLPSADLAVPSYLKAYRGYGRIAAHQVIPGYERRQVGQFDFTTIRILSANPLGADQLTFIGEVGGTYIFDMPDHSELQFEGGGPVRTHASRGADGTGNNGVVPTPTTLNPTQQTRGFATQFSWGLRGIMRAEYNDVMFGWSFRPTVIAAWDVNGTAPYPIQNFVEQRKQVVAGTEINFSQSLAGRILYDVYFGGHPGENALADRDNIAVSALYTF